MKKGRQCSGVVEVRDADFTAGEKKRTKGTV